MFAQWRRLSTEVSLLFQILVSLVTISDWPRRDSWQHFYTRGLPTKKLQATVPTSLSTSHTLHIHSKLLVLQKNRCMRNKTIVYYYFTKFPTGFYRGVQFGIKILKKKIIKELKNYIPPPPIKKPFSGTYPVIHPSRAHRCSLSRARASEKSFVTCLPWCSVFKKGEGKGVWWHFFAKRNWFFTCACACDGVQKYASHDDAGWHQDAQQWCECHNIDAKQK